MEGLNTRMQQSVFNHILEEKGDGCLDPLMIPRESIDAARGRLPR